MKDTTVGVPVLVVAAALLFSFSVLDVLSVAAVVIFTGGGMV